MQSGLVINIDGTLKEIGKESSSASWCNLYILFLINNQEFWLQITKRNKPGHVSLTDELHLAGKKVGCIYRLTIDVKQSKNKSVKLRLKRLVQI